MTDNKSEITVEFEADNTSLTEIQEEVYQYIAERLLSLDIPVKSNLIYKDRELSALRYVLHNMSEEDAREFLVEMADAPEEILRSAKRRIDTVVKSFRKYDYQNEQAVIINGNRFTFTRGTLDIDMFKEQLYAIGENGKGNTWHLMLDGDRELVIY